MKRSLAMALTLAMLVSGCSGGNDGSDGDGAVVTGQSGEPGDDSPPEGDSATSNDSDTRLFTLSVLSDGVDIVNLDEETQDQFVSGIDQAHTLTLVGDSLWIGSGEDTLVRVDADNGEELGRVTLPGRFSGELVVKNGSAITIAGLVGIETSLVVIDMNSMSVSGTSSSPQGSFYTDLAVAGGEVWVFGGDIELSTTVAVVDLGTATAGAAVDVGVIADSMIGDGNTLWVGGTIPAFINELGTPTAGLAKLDTTSLGVERFDFMAPGDNEVETAVAYGYLWASLGLDGQLLKLDKGSAVEIGRVGTGDGAAGVPYPILIYQDLIWVFNPTQDGAPAFDPETLELETGINVPTFAGAPVFAP